MCRGPVGGHRAVATLEGIRDQDLWHAAKRRKGADMGADPIGQTLAPRRFGKGSIVEGVRQGPGQTATCARRTDSATVGRLTRKLYASLRSLRPQAHVNRKTART